MTRSGVKMEWHTNEKGKSLKSSSHHSLPVAQIQQWNNFIAEKYKHLILQWGNKAEFVHTVTNPNKKYSVIKK